MSELSKKIKEARETKGLSIEELAEKTKISHKFLRALEEDRKHQLPGRVVVKGFVKRLAKFLDAREEEFAKLFDAEFPETEAPQIIPPEKKKEFAFKKEHLYLLVSGIVLILAIITAINLYFSNPPSRQVSQPAAEVPPTPVEPVASEAAQPTPAPSPANGVHVTLTAQEDVWVQVILDGQRVYEDVIKKNTSKTFDAKERARIYAGNAPKILVKINNKDFGPLDPNKTLSRILFVLGDEKPTILPPPRRDENTTNQ